MGNKRIFAYRNANEDEYIFDQLVNYPTWAKAKLSPRELMIFKSENSIRQFVQNATSDQKKLILAKANICSISLYLDMNKKEPLSALQNIKKLHRSTTVAEDRQKVIEEIQANNTFVVTSREILNAAYLIAQNCHTPYFFINQNFKRTYNAIDSLRMKGLNNYNASPETQMMKDADSYRDVCMNFYLASQTSEHYVKITQRLEVIDMRILGFLFLHRDTYVEKRVLHNVMFDYKPNYVTNRLSRLVKDHFIDINRHNVRKLCYTIAEMGTIAANELLEKLTQQAVAI